MDEPSREVLETLKDMRTTMDEIHAMRRSLPGTSTTNNNNPVVKVEAGGFALWLAAMCCAVSVTFGITTQNQLTREIARKDGEVKELRESYDTAKTLLAAIYAQAPHLKPKESK